ncbi:MAG: amidohydrolase family protein [Candidatus Bathyarchaeia archaeon]
MGFIDIHVHVRKRPGPLRGGKQSYITPQQLIKRYDEIGIERGVLLPGVNPECSVQIQSNEEILEIAEAYPDRFIPFCNIDPRAISNAPDAPLDELLNYYREMGCRGIGEVAANLPFLHPLVQNLFKHVQKVGFPLTFHVAPQIGGAYGLYDDPGLPQLERCLQLFPNLKFLGHSQPFWAEISQLETPADRYGYPKYPVKEEGVVPKLMRRYQNLYGDLSAYSGYNALARDLVYAVQFLTEFQDRLLFGTDIVAPDTPAPLADLLLKLLNEGQISEKIFRKIARENALKLLKL